MFIRRNTLIGLGILGLALLSRADDGVRLSAESLAPVAAIVEAEIQAGHIPGAVVAIGQDGQIVYQRAFGQRSQDQAMSEDTVFDLASLTKAVATTTAVLQLAERGKLRLDAPVARYWPAFAAHGKAGISVAQLLAHSSGLRPDLPLQPAWSGYRAALRLIIDEQPVAPPGRSVLYSDINFAILGELVRRVSGLPLDVYCQRRIFSPLAMADTGFHPLPRLRPRIAPTGFLNGQLRRGQVHDPMAYRMGGVAGHAGLFSTAADLARFAQMLLNGGTLRGQRILRNDTVADLALPQAPILQPPLRGLGWRLDPPFAANREQLPPLGAISHYGYTGTALWVDPVTQTFVIILSHRVHPDGRGDAGPLRRQIAAAVGNALGPLGFDQVTAVQPLLAPYVAVASFLPGPAGATAGPVATGIDVLAAQGFATLAGLRIGLITNRSGVDRAGRSSVELLRQAPGVKLAALFSPEHGLGSDQDAAIASGSEPGSGLPIHSLYGESKRPTPAMLTGLDALVFDLQDAGARFYTYATTMAYAMEAAAEQGIPFYLLDRPDPIGGEAVQGPLLDPDRLSFTGYFPLPVRHGMTLGELARLFNAENQIGAKLTVIPMQGYRRSDWYDQTGLPWIPPSPNLRSLAAATLYPGLGLLEGANLSVGRGTATPFEVIGAPWIDGLALAQFLNARAIPGVHFEPTQFTPTENRYRQHPCQGLRIFILDRQVLDTPLLGIEIAHALYALYPQTFQLDRTLAAIGSRQVVEAIRQGVDPQAIAAAWQEPLAQFKKMRQQYLLYE